jgi:hypothetical protein
MANRERILKAVREKIQITYKGKPIKITADFSMETLKARKAWREVFNLRILYPAKLSFKVDGAIKVFHDKQKLKQYMTIKSPVQKIVQGVLHTENERRKTMTGQAAPNHRRRKDKNQRVTLIKLHTIKPLNNKNN